MTARFDDEITVHLGDLQDDQTENSFAAPPSLGKSIRSAQEDYSLHYSDASSSAMTHLPVCDAHYGEETLRTRERTLSVEASSLGGGAIPSRDDVSIATTLVTYPTFGGNHSVSDRSHLTSASFNSSYETSSRQGAKINLAFLPVRETRGSSSGGSVYSRSSKQSVRRRDVIKPVALPPQAPAPFEPKEEFGALVPSSRVPKSQWILPSNPQAGCADLVTCPTNAYALPILNNDLALVLHGTEPRGTDPPETTRGNGLDPPGEEPAARPSPSRPPHGKRYRSVQWVDPKSITDESQIDYDMLNRYRELSSIDSTYYTETSEPLPGRDKRIRIATISSGYKTANFFVREDLDQRIYFHELEDAVSYMARRGYARMEKGEEQEWMKLLGRAHQVVKVGPTKKKQRYRKGKLVLIMYKPIVDEVDHYSDIKRRDSSSTATTHTSLGRSIRGGYKSYSEKFLAEQESEKKYGLLMLTNGDLVDAPGNHSGDVSHGGLLQLTNGVSTMSVVEEEKSRSTASASDKRGVYGGGIRYFTPDKSYEEDEESEEGEDEEEEEVIEVEGSDMGSMFSEEDESHRPNNDGVESVASSTINSEMSSIARNAGGVHMAGENKYGNKNTLNKKRAPTPFDKSPDMVAISDGSESGSWERQ